MADDCMFCDEARANKTLGRITVWQDDLWRAAVRLEGPVPGYTYLEAKRHIPSLSELDGPEATTCGSALARVAAALKQARPCEKVYTFSFGLSPHLHFGMAPHVEGGPLLGPVGMVPPGTALADPEHSRAISRRVEELLA
jgi:diadenosine tetraphosphate (Ap4A) HIT family hydrolase